MKRPARTAKLQTTFATDCGAALSHHEATRDEVVLKNDALRCVKHRVYV